MDVQGRAFTADYMKGLSEFMKCAEDHREMIGETKISCHCKECRNIVSIADPNMIRRHRIKQGFDKSYTCWDLYGEPREPRVDSNTFVSDTNHEENDSNDNNHRDNLDEMLHDVEMVKLLDLKAKSNWSDKSFTTLLELLHEAFPEDNELPVSTYQAKKLTCPMGLEVNARKDMVELRIINELAPQVMNGTKMYLSPACYTLSKDEKTIFCECLHGVKVPSGYFANIRKVLPPPVRQTITKLCLFFNMIHSKFIDHEKLDEWQSDIILILCQLEMYFPPSFFDVMVHLISHIVEEIKYDGHVFLRYMYVFERYMGYLKAYVRNRYRPEGSIVQGYASEELERTGIGYVEKN
nr:hypothetical protein [Tanacetum cinerariifolium]